MSKTSVKSKSKTKVPAKEKAKRRAELARTIDSQMQLWADSIHKPEVIRLFAGACAPIVIALAMQQLCSIKNDTKGFAKYANDELNAFYDLVASAPKGAAK